MGRFLIDLLDGNGLTGIPVGQFHGRVCKLIQSGCNTSELLEWREQHRAAFRQFFAHDRHASVDLKKQFEAIEAELASEKKPTLTEVSRG